MMFLLGSYFPSFDNPQSIVYLILGIVKDVSATFVENITLRVMWGSFGEKTKSCSSGFSLPCSGRHKTLLTLLDLQRDWNMLIAFSISRGSTRKAKISPFSKLWRISKAVSTVPLIWSSFELSKRKR